MIASGLIPVSDLALKDILTTRIRAEMSQNIEEIMVTSGSRPWVTSLSSERTKSPPAEADRHSIHKLLINGFDSKEHLKRDTCKISSMSKESSHVTT